MKALLKYLHRPKHLFTYQWERGKLTFSSTSPPIYSTLLSPSLRLLSLISLSLPSITVCWTAFYGTDQLALALASITLKLFLLYIPRRCRSTHLPVSSTRPSPSHLNSHHESLISEPSSPILSPLRTSHPLLSWSHTSFSSSLIASSPLSFYHHPIMPQSRAGKVCQQISSSPEFNLIVCFTSSLVTHPQTHRLFTFLSIYIYLPTELIYTLLEIFIC